MNQFNNHEKDFLEFSCVCMCVCDSPTACVLFDLISLEQKRPQNKEKKQVSGVLDSIPGSTTLFYFYLCYHIFIYKIRPTVFTFMLVI